MDDKRAPVQELLLRGAVTRISTEGRKSWVIPCNKSGGAGAYKSSGCL